MSIGSALILVMVVALSAELVLDHFFPIDDRCCPADGKLRFTVGTPPTIASVRSLLGQRFKAGLEKLRALNGRELDAAFARMATAAQISPDVEEALVRAIFQGRGIC